MKSRISKHISTFVATILGSASLFGAGYQIQEQGASNLGTSNAGAVVNANDDASAAFWNPSTASFMSLKEGETLVNAALTFVIPTLGLSNDTGDYDCGTLAEVPNLFVVHKLTEDFALTLSVSAPYGLESKYDDSWLGVGSNQGIRSYLFTTDINPSFSYKVNDWLSIGGGVSAQYAYVKLTGTTSVHPALPLFSTDVRGQGWAVGGNAGFTIKYAEDGRIGFHWRSEVQHHLDGTFRLNGVPNKAVTADMQMPHTFNVGIYQRLRGDFSQFAVMFEYVYSMWSTFEQLYIPEIPERVEENWKDTSKFSFGIHYYPEQIEGLTLRLGAAFDESPVRDAAHRTPRIPCSDRVWVSVGAGYEFWENFSVDLAYCFITCIGSSDTNQVGVANPVQGNYFGHIHVVSAQVGYKF